MKLHLLLTDDIAKTKPSTCKTIADYGTLKVIFEDFVRVGVHCIVEDTEENIINWLKPFECFVKGSGIPQFEDFSIVHVKK
jgi:hypothetical protein